MMLTILLYLLYIWNLVSGDTNVKGILLQKCILPCSFTPSPNELVHWQRKINGSPLVVHSYYDGRDQLNHQDTQYKNRTSLFSKELGRGNASLLLSNLQLSDSGNYICYVSNEAGKTDKTISLQVTAPIMYLEFNFMAKNESVTVQCGATGVPKPDLRWADENGIQQNSDSSIVSPNGLYSVTENLNVTDLSKTYICTARQDMLNQMWELAWKMQGEITRKENSYASLPCIFSKDNADTTDFVVVWTLKTQNGKRSVLHYVNKTSVYDPFKGRASISESELSQGVATLHLVALTLADKGEYTCNVSSKNSYQLRITPLHIDPAQDSGENSFSAGRITGIFFCIILIVLVLFGLCWCCCKNIKNNFGGSFPCCTEKSVV